jgi:hypothetical protein
MAETTPGAGNVKPIITKAARARLAPKEAGRPLNRLTGGLLGAPSKRAASQVNVPATPAKF